MLVDTHCHIHDHEFFDTAAAEEAYLNARTAGVSMICVGTTQPDSRAAVEFAAAHDATWAIVGVHPHEAKDGVADIGAILAEKHEKIVGIGEIGLDYYYNHSPREVQIAALEQQLQWAVDYNLPVSFHVREAYEDFWPILANFSGIRGVLHSFTDTQANADRALEQGLYIGVNGISTFTRDAEQQKMFKNLPLKRILLETDAPFLTPEPFRGKINTPAYVSRVADFHAEIRGIETAEVAKITSDNAKSLFAI